MIAMTEIQRVGDLPAAPGLDPLEAAATAQLASGLPKPPHAFPEIGASKPWKNVSAEPNTLRDVLKALGDSLSKEETVACPNGKPEMLPHDDLPDADFVKTAALPVVETLPAGKPVVPSSASNPKTPIDEVAPAVLSHPQAPVVLPDAPKGEQPTAPAATPAPTQPIAPADDAPILPGAMEPSATMKPQVAPQTVPQQVIPQVAPQTVSQQLIPQTPPQTVPPQVIPQTPLQPEQPTTPAVPQQVIPQTPLQPEQPTTPAVTPAPTPSAEVKPQVIPQAPIAQPDAPKGEQTVLPGVAPTPVVPGEPVETPVLPAAAVPPAEVKPQVAPQGGETVSTEAPVQKEPGVAVTPQQPTALPQGEKVPLAKPDVLPVSSKEETKSVERTAEVVSAPAQVMAQPVAVDAPAPIAPAAAPVAAPQVAQMVAAAEAVTAAISVSHALATTGEGEIHVQLKEDVLDGSSLRLTVKGGDIKILITPATRAAEETFVKHQEAFQTHLAERVTTWRISVGVALWGSRTFGNYRSEEEV